MSRAGWRETTLGEVVLINPKVPKLQEDSPFIEMADVDTWGRWAFPSGPKGKRGGIRATGGDTLMARITPCLENGKIAQIPDDYGDVGGSTEFIVLRATDETIPEFVFLLAQSHRVHSESIGLMVGTSGRQRVSAKDVASIQVFLPPVEEQREIVNLMQALDHMIQAGDREISSTERMRRDILDALLDPAGQSWEEIMLGERISITRRNVKPENFGSEIVPLYSIPGFDDGEFPQETESNSVKSTKLEVDEDSILISLLNPRIPRVSQAMIPGYCSTEFAVVQPEDGLDFDFLYYLFSGTEFSDYLTKASRGTTGSRTRATRQDILDYPASVPSLGAQEKIVEKMQTLDAYLESAKRSQEALKQVRKDALHALLSGDKDVRDLAEMFATDEDMA